MNEYKKFHLTRTKPIHTHKNNNQAPMKQFH